MARPTRQGVDYFPLDVHLDNKFKFIEIKFGLEGFAVVIKILQEIYAQGYFCEWGDDEKLLFSDEHKIEFEKLKLITNECLLRDIFNKELYENHKILTSKGIQARYQEIVKRRRDVEMDASYLLIEGSFGVNVSTMSTSCKQDVSKSTQSKVKESKVNKSKVKNINDVVQKNNFEPHHLKLAELLYKKIKENNPKAKEPNYKSWTNTFRLMMEIDKREGKEIQELIIWAQGHHFWHTNILSATKLRKQYDQLTLQKQGGLKVINGKQVSKEIIPEWFADRNKRVETEVAKELTPDQEKERQELAALIKENS